ncbi:unnamed protein product [Cuscuta campestris]|uniref:Uncharacterized protein n=1 Tax=Cuscuta campestris TaxID=132261 RepID=A0A484M1F0_9ASTE|nr:unnamed protein product [Cuscuta campestris]
MPIYTIFGWKGHSSITAECHGKSIHNPQPMNCSPNVAANPHKILSQFHYSDILSKPTYRQHLKKWMPRFALPPTSSSSKQNHRRNELSKFSPQPSWQGHWPSMSSSQSSFPSSPEGLLAPQSSAMVPSSHFTTLKLAVFQEKEDGDSTAIATAGTTATAS